MERRKHWKVLYTGFGLVLLLLAVPRSLALADDYDCSGTLGSVTVDNLNVPQNATCILNGTRVEGNLFVRDRAALYANVVQVDGNIQADRAARVEVHSGSFVGGDIQVINSGSLLVTRVRVGGNLQAFDNTSSQLFANNIIGGDLQAFDNLGGVIIWNNTIDGNLQCKQNVPPPTGGNNQVGGNKEDQCADLQPGAPISPGALPFLEGSYRLFIAFADR